MKRTLVALVFLAPLNVFGANNLLTWDDVLGEDGFTVYGKNEACSSGALTYSPLGNTQVDVLTFTHTTGANDDGFSWCYVVTAFNANGESGFSNEAGKVPASPGSLRVN